MADKVRGITIEVAADGSKFKSAMSEIRANAKSSQKELNALQKSLELEFDGKKLEEAQKIAQKAIDATAEKADALRLRLQELEKQGKMDTRGYAEAKAELAQTELQAQQLEKQLEKLNTMKLDHLAGQVSNVGGKITSVGQALTPISVTAAGAITGLGTLGSKAVQTADEIATLATQYDISTEALQRFDYIALQTDTDSEALYKAFVKMRAGIADFATGTNSVASAALEKLNLDINSFGGSEEQFYGIITALANMEDKTQMVAIANDLFGEKLANNLLPLIYSGSDAIAAYSAEFDNLGALSDEAVIKLAEFDNVLNTINTQLANVALQTGASLLPVMQSLADFVETKLTPKLQTLSDWFGSLSLGQQEFALKALAVIAVLAPLTIGVGNLVSAVGNIIKKLPALQSGLSALSSHPIILIIAAIAMILLLLYTRCEAFRESVNKLVSLLGESLQPVLDVVVGLLSSTTKQLSPLLNILGGILGTINNLVFDALTPLTERLALIMKIIEPLLTIVLLPLQLALTRLQIPLQMIGILLGWLSQLFGGFSSIAQSVFAKVIEVINTVLGWVEYAINWVINKINSLIDMVNKVGGAVGITIDRVERVSLQTSPDTSGASDETPTPDITPTDTGGSGALNPYTTYDQIGTGTTTGDTYNYDYSTNETTQHVTVTIENYAAEVDVDALVDEINVKLAEAM